MRIQKSRVRLKDIVLPGRGDQFYVEPVPRLINLITDMMTGKAPSWTTRTRVADLGVHDVKALARVRAALAEEPGLYAALKGMLGQGASPWLVYRGAGGDLIMFDDYPFYAVALEEGVEEVNVQIIGESAPARPDIEI